MKKYYTLISSFTKLVLRMPTTMRSEKAVPQFSPFTLCGSIVKWKEKIEGQPFSFYPWQTPKVKNLEIVLFSQGLFFLSLFSCGFSFLFRFFRKLQLMCQY